ncbi:MAG: dienelactone hydrolase family protein [Archangiaceae bacterium]|nr:dienelactone hydrolase family protein [Archangiaceae bacterium]
MNTLTLKTADGPARTAVFEPAHAVAPLPAVVFFIDGAGWRPAMFEMGERLASNGYLVVMPDLFHRGGAYDPEQLKAAIFGKVDRTEWKTKFYEPAKTPQAAKVDAAAAFEYLNGRADVKKHHFGTTGYCMGGFLSLTAAGNFPAEVAAACSFHGGGLATEAPGSPHRLAGQMKAEVYVAGAHDDSSFDDASKQLLEQALTEAKVKHVIETYPARHGFAVPDFTGVFDAAQAERHWAAMLGLFGRVLKW